MAAPGQTGPQPLHSSAISNPPQSLLAAGTLASLITLARLAPYTGIFAEIGVYKGGSAWHLAQLGRELHLFDSFTGMPVANPDDEHKIGDFSDTSAEAVAAAIPAAILHVGTFPATLPDGLTGFAFVHVDCDQYASVRDCIIDLAPRMVSGGIMLFDDWHCTNGATKAISEAFTAIWQTPQGRAFVIFE